MNHQELPDFDVFAVFAASDFPHGVLCAGRHPGVFLRIDLPPTGDHAAVLAQFILLFGELIGLLNDAGMIAIVGEDGEFQAAQLGDMLLFIADDVLVGAGNDDLDPVVPDAADRDFFGAGRIDAAADRLDHFVQRRRVDRLAFGLRLFDVDLIDEIGAASQVDAQPDRAAPAVLLVHQLLVDERRHAEKHGEQHHADLERQILQPQRLADEGPQHEGQNEDHRADDQQLPRHAGVLRRGRVFTRAMLHLSMCRSCLHSILSENEEPRFAI